MRSDSTVPQLHQALQVAFGWEDEHLNRFEILGREYAVYRDGGGQLCDLIKLRFHIGMRVEQLSQTA